MKSPWKDVTKELPVTSDRGVLVYYSVQDTVESVHVEDYFLPITDGVDEEGNQLYTYWYQAQGVTHWLELPLSPSWYSN